MQISLIRPYPLARLSRILQNTFVLEAVPTVLLTMILVGYMSLSFNRYLPMQEGWFTYYSQLMDQGRFPYRDFYVHIQPIYLYLISGLGKIFGNEFIVLRTYGIIERCLIGVLLFYHMKKYFPPASSFLGVILGLFIYSSFNVDLSYSYYQTSLLLTFLSAIFLFRAIDITESQSLNGHIWIILAGIFSALAFFTKQSSGLLFLILYLMIISLYYFRLAGFGVALKEILLFFAGFLMVAGGVIVWLGHHHALSDYCRIVFGSASSKGDLNDILFGFIARLFSGKHYIINITFIAIMSGLTLYSAFRKESSFSLNIHSRKSNYITISILSLIMVLAYGLPYLTSPINVNSSLQIIQHCILLTTFIGIVLLTFVFFYRWIRQAHDQQNNYFLFTSLFSLTWMYSHGMSGVLEVSALLPALPFLTLFLLTSYHDVWIRNVLCKGGVVFCVLCVFLIAADRYQRPYYWWGWGEPDLRTAKYSSNIPVLRGLYLSKSTKEVYERIHDLIIENTYVEDEVFTFPHIVLFNVITGRTNSNFVPVTYFDVCADNYAILTAQYIIEKKPKIIVMMEFPEDAWVAHETIFRGGRKSGQRQIMESIKRLKAQGFYHTIGREEVEGNYPVEILRLT